MIKVEGTQDGLTVKIDTDAIVLVQEEPQGSVTLTAGDLEFVKKVYQKYLNVQDA